MCSYSGYGYIFGGMRFGRKIVKKILFSQKEKNYSSVVMLILKNIMFLHRWEDFS